MEGKAVFSLGSKGALRAAEAGSNATLVVTMTTETLAILVLTTTLVTRIQLLWPWNNSGLKIVGAINACVMNNDVIKSV